MVHLGKQLQLIDKTKMPPQPRIYRFAQVAALGVVIRPFGV